VTGHLRRNADKMLQTAKRWATEASQSEASRSEQLMRGCEHRVPDKGFGTQAVKYLAKTLPELQKVLGKYGATYVPQKIVPPS
jgi:hypothetical protein